MSLAKQVNIKTLIWLVTTVSLVFLASSLVSAQSPNPQASGVGVQGTISSPPPTTSPTISSPGNGATFTTLPITVQGICTSDLLVKIFKNSVFSGSAMCKNGSYSIQIDLFSSKNDLYAKHYDALDQSGPSSNLVSVTFNDNTARPDIAARVSLTSNYARRGANPKELLTWPLLLSGGTAPYAVSTDWGDAASADVQTVTTPGEFSIKHTYDSAGVYRILVKVSDKNGSVAYLQLVGIANGEVKQQNGQVAGASAGSGSGSGTGKTVIVWQPAAIALPLIFTTFWLGKKYEVKRIRKRLSEGKIPFKY